jgi:hypothetical protein
MMSETTLDLRYPEIYLENAGNIMNELQLQSAINLGQQYRNAKRALKTHAEDKKQLSKSFKAIRDDLDLKKSMISTLSNSATKLIRQKHSLKSSRLK